jgi:hypothetical protein
MFDFMAANLLPCNNSKKYFFVFLANVLILWVNVPFQATNSQKSVVRIFEIAVTKGDFQAAPLR